MNIKVSITGLGEIQEAVRRAPEFTKNEIGKAIQKSVLSIHNQAIKEAPVNKQTGGGNLRQNIRSRIISKTSGVVESRAPYSVYVHEGTKPHTIEAVNKRVLANRRTGQIFGRKVNHPGTRPNPYMMRALENSKQAIERFFQNAVDSVLKVFPR